jgi:hypothetical protein
MSISLYQVSVPAMIRGLINLSAILEKASAHAAAKKFDGIVFAQSRLFPDMLPLTRQVQIACDTAKGAAARLAGVDIPKHEDTETTLPELQARIAATVAFLKGLNAEQMAGDETRPIELKFPNRVLKFTAVSYLTDFVLPNFYFHSTMVYALLREGGVEIGKSDYLGAIQ